MLKSTSKQLSLYSILYDKIPDDHQLKSIDKAVDFRVCDQSGAVFKKMQQKADPLIIISRKVIYWLKKL